MAEYQADLAVAQRVLNAVKDNVDMDKTETKLLVVLAIELEVTVTREKFVGPRNEHRNSPPLHRCVVKVSSAN